MQNLLILFWSYFVGIAHAFDYDLCIIGSGAAGLFASGAAQLFTKNYCLVEHAPFAGGDCTNAACVPSKAFRVAGTQSMMSPKDYVFETVHNVRARENPSNCLHVSECQFTDPHTLQLTYHNSTVRQITSERFLIATGARPVVPPSWQATAEQAGLPLATYQTLLNPETDDPIWNVLDNPNRTIVVVGGGATACELIQSITKSFPATVQWITSSVLSSEDVELQNSAVQLILESCQVKLLCARATNILSNSSVELDHGVRYVAADAVLVCIGRTPNTETLNLERAQVKTRNGQIVVNQHLRTSSSHIFAAGDCCLPGRLRTASQAAWTGFHAVRNMFVPRFFRILDKPSIQFNLPRVIYTEYVWFLLVSLTFKSPEMSCVGLTYSECVNIYGMKGFRSLKVRDDGMDRADMDRGIRNIKPCYVELRSHKVTGRLLGCTLCGPTAAEQANLMGVAMTNRLSVLDIARSPHSYPSYGYLQYRVALAMALSSIWGSIEITIGPIGRILSFCEQSEPMF